MPKVSCLETFKDGSAYLPLFDTNIISLPTSLSFFHNSLSTRSTTIGWLLAAISGEYSYSLIVVENQ